MSPLLQEELFKNQNECKGKRLIRSYCIVDSFLFCNKYYIVQIQVSGVVISKYCDIYKRISESCTGG